MGKKLFYILFILLLLCLSSCVKRDIRADYTDACVELEINGTVYASGFIIDDKGSILTSAHSFKGLYEAKDISIYANTYAKAYQIKLISIDFDKDIALLKGEFSVPYYISLDSRKLKTCEYAYVLGNAYGEGIKPCRVRVVNDNIKICTDTKSYLGAIFTGEIALGCSGAPVVGENGKLLGMVVGKGAENNEVYALSPIEINTFLEEYL